MPLTPGSRERLAGLSLPPHWREARIIASPLSRARDTAHLLSGAPPPTDARLVEMDFGDWEGAEAAILKGDPARGVRGVAEWGWEHGPQGGETAREVLARASALLHELERGGDVLIVSHLVVMRVLLARAHDWDCLGPAPFNIEQEHIYELTLTPDRALALTDGTLQASPIPLSHGT